MPSLTVIMPTYNEIGCIRDAVEDVENNILSKIPNSNLIIVDDGSLDGTSAVLDTLSLSHPKLQALHQVNQGHGPALITGVTHSDSDWLLLLDSDMEISLEHFGNYWRQREDFDAILGVRQNRKSPLDRKTATIGLRIMLRILGGGWTKDANCPFKLVRQRYCLGIFKVFPADYQIPSALLSSWLVKCGAKVQWENVDYHFRATGTVSLNKKKLLHLAIKAYKQTRLVIVNLNRTKL